jgi:hypothetical protein
LSVKVVQKSCMTRNLTHRIQALLTN